MTPDTYTQIKTRLARRRRRFLLVATATLAMLAAALGVSFAGPTGLASATIDTTASNNFIYPVAVNGTVPSGLGANNGATPPVFTTALKYTTPSGFTTASPVAFQSTATNIITPKWAPVAGTAGSVTTPGDLAIVDARSATLGANFTALRVTVFITNLDKLQPNYSSFAFPLQVYSCTAADCDGTGDWTLASGFDVNAPVYVTNTDGFVSFTLPRGTEQFYDITIDAGGSFYTIGTTDDATKDLAPQFYFTAQAI